MRPDISNNPDSPTVSELWGKMTTEDRRALAIAASEHIATPQPDPRALQRLATLGLIDQDGRPTYRA